VGGLTYSGHPVCCAAAVANLHIYEEERLFENVEKQGRYLASVLSDEEKICLRGRRPL